MIAVWIDVLEPDLPLTTGTTTAFIHTCIGTYASGFIPRWLQFASIEGETLMITMMIG